MHGYIPRQYGRVQYRYSPYTSKSWYNHYTQRYGDFCLVPRYGDDITFDTFFYQKRNTKKYDRRHKSIIDNDVIHQKPSGIFQNDVWIGEFKVNSNFIVPEGIFSYMPGYGAKYYSTYSWLATITDTFQGGLYAILKPSNLSKYILGIGTVYAPQAEIGIRFWDPKLKAYKSRYFVSNKVEFDGNKVKYDLSSSGNRYFPSFVAVLVENWVNSNLYRLTSESLMIQEEHMARGESFFSSVYSLFPDLISDDDDNQKTPHGWGDTTKTSYVFKGDIPHPEGKPSLFYFYEIEEIRDGLDAGIFYSGTRRYWKQYLIQHSYLDALQSMPRMSENNISNILDICSFVYSLVVKHRIEIPQNLSDAWLAYRYQYSTTKADIRDAIDFMNRYTDFEELGKTITLYGTSYRTVDGIDVTCRCRCKVSNKTLDKIQEVWKALYTYGLQPNFYVVWDMIPFSFVADWFIPVGNVAGVLDAQNMYSGTYYDITHVIFSLEYSRDGYHMYTRWRSVNPPELRSFYWFENDNVSDKTIMKRILDAGSLFIS